MATMGKENRVRLHQKQGLGSGMEVYVFNPTNSGGRGRQICSLVYIASARPPGTNYRRPYLDNTKEKRKNKEWTAVVTPRVEFSPAKQ